MSNTINDRTLLRLSNLIGRPLNTVAQTEVGKISDILFDDLTWQVRYLVGELGSWLDRKQVLISPMAIGNISDAAIELNLTEKLLADSPSADFAKPISRQYETDLYNYYAWTPYWRPPLVPGDTGGMMVLPTAVLADVAASTEDVDGDPHLRSFKTVINYNISALDGSIGHIEDFIVNAERWKLRYFVVDTANWLPGRKVILPPSWISDINWTTSVVTVELATNTIEQAPELDIVQLNRDYEQRLHAHYEQTPYWESE